MRFVRPGLLKSLSAKVLLAYLVGVMVSITLVIMLAFRVVVEQRHYFAGLDITDLTVKQADNVIFNEDGVPIGFSAHDVDLVWLFESLKQETAYRLLDATGQTVLMSAAGDEFWQSSDTVLQKEPKSFDFYYQGNLIYGATAPVNHGEITWYLQFASSARLHNLIYQKFALPFMSGGIILFSLVLFFVFGICGYLTLRYMLGPLRDLSASAAAISPRSLHTRLGVDQVPSELVPLVNSFNNALDRLEHGYRTQQDFLATAAHELKTPLALLRAQIEVKEKWDDRVLLLNDIEHMSRQVQQLLLLAEVSEEKNYVLENVDIAEVVKEVISYLNPMAVMAGVQLTIVQKSRENWHADRSALFVLIKNLMENAIQHAPSDTEVCCEMNSGWLTIRDWGPGVDEEQLSKIFLRFWRSAHRRDQGAGLGLAICQEIAQAHSWLLSVQRSEPGLCFRLSLPRLENAI